MHAAIHRARRGRWGHVLPWEPIQQIWLGSQQEAIIHTLPNKRTCQDQPSILPIKGILVLFAVTVPKMGGSAVLFYIISSVAEEDTHGGSRSDLWRQRAGALATEGQLVAIDIPAETGQIKALRGGRALHTRGPERQRRRLLLQLGAHQGCALLAQQ